MSWFDYIKSLPEEQRRKLLKNLINSMDIEYVESLIEEEVHTMLNDAHENLLPELTDEDIILKLRCNIET